MHRCDFAREAYSGSRRVWSCRVGRSGGFTLAEALVAVLMLSIGIVAVASSFSLAARAEARAHRLAVASLLADEKMVELQLESARRVGASEGDFGPAFPGYAWEANVTPTQTARLYVTELTVYYGNTGKAGETRTQLVKIVTLLRV